VCRQMCWCRRIRCGAGAWRRSWSTKGGPRRCEGSFETFGDLGGDFLGRWEGVGVFLAGILQREHVEVELVALVKRLSLPRVA